MALADGGWTLVNNNDKGNPYGVLKYAELEESGDARITPDDSSVMGVYGVDQEYSLNFIDDLYGYSTFLADGSNYSITRVLPQQHNQYTSFYVNGIASKNLSVTGNTGGIGQWKACRVEAEYRPLNYAVLADGAIGTISYTNPIDNMSYTAPNELNRFCTRTYSFVIQQLTTQGLMQFVSRWNDVTNPSPPPATIPQQINAALDTAPGQMIVFLEKEITWHQVPARAVGYNIFEPPNRATVNAIGGCLNSVAFDGHNPGTVLFVGYQPVLRKPNLETGLYTWDLTYRFLVQDHGQVTVTDYTGGMLTEYAGPAYIYDTLFERWDLVTSDGTVDGSPLYPSKDLNSLFAFQGNS